jgi:hypothetical protein
LAFFIGIPLSSLAQISQGGWSEGFENYASGAFPSPDWTFSGNADIRVDNAVHASGLQSVRLNGAVGGCWAALLHRPLNLSAAFTLEFQTRNGSETLSGCHPLRSMMMLHTGPSWTYPLRKLISFDGDGKIRGSYSASNGFVGSVLGDYAVGQWIRVKLTYEKPDAATVRLNYWINDQFKLSETLTAFSHETQLAYLSPSGAEGTAWFDDITLTPGANVSCSYSLSPPSQSFVSTGGAGNVSVTAPSGCNWQAVSNASWITLTSPASGSGSGTVSYVVAANPGTAARTGNLSIAGQTLTVTQAGPGTGSAVILSEDFEDSVLDSRISIQTTGTFSSSPAIKNFTGFGSTKAFGYGRSTCGLSCFNSFVTGLKITLTGAQLCGLCFLQGNGVVRQLGLYRVSLCRRCVVDERDF